MAHDTAPRPLTEPATAAHGAIAARTPAQLFALAFGTVYLLVGVAGFAVTGFHGFASSKGSTLVIFSVNPLHNIVHLALAAVWLVGARSPRPARAANLVIGGVLGLVTILGLAHALDFLGIDGLQNPDNFLHLFTAALALYFGSAGAEYARREPVALDPVEW